MRRPAGATGTPPRAPRGTPPPSSGPPAQDFTRPRRRGGMAQPPPVVVLVGPSHPGNVGAVARVAANFGVQDLRFVLPRCDVRAAEAMERAVHAKPLLERAR